MGAGARISRNYVLTCAHVVSQALNLDCVPQDRPLGSIYLDLPLITPGEMLSAHVAIWKPEADIAGLVLDFSPAIPSDPGKVLGITAKDLWGHSFRAFGFPPDYDDGVWTSGLFRGKNASGWLQIEDIKVTGYLVAPGFSGTPVWDSELQGITGIVVAADISPNKRAAFIIPIENLMEAWPGLSDLLLVELPDLPPDRARQNLVADLVITYAPSDDLLAQQMSDRLTAEGFTCYLAKLGSPSKAELDQSVSKAIGGCSIFLIIFTQNTSEAIANCSELKSALDLDKEVIIAAFGVWNGSADAKSARWLNLGYVFDAGIEQLLQYLEWYRSPAGQVEALHNRILRLREHLNNETGNVRLQVQVEILTEQLKYQERLAEDPITVRSDYKAAVQKGITADRERFLAARVAEQTQSRCRVVGNAPQTETLFFKNRSSALASLMDMLLDTKKHAISIYGKAGAGKTALACRALAALESDPKNIYGLVYLSTHSGLGISLEQIYLKSARMLGGQAEEQLIAAWTNAQFDNQTRIQMLLENYGDKRCIILLDNLEELLDADGRLLDDDLRLFVHSFLRQQHQSCLMITSREALYLEDDVSRYESRLYLWDGLPEEHAIALLTDMDRDGGLGLSDADPDLLRRIAQRSQGYPRAIERIAGILAQDPFLAPERLLQQEGLFEREVVEDLAHEAYLRLDGDARAVMQALSVYRRPVSDTAVRFMLEPFFALPLDIAGILKRLVRGFYISVDRRTHQITLHPLDQIYSYGQIPDSGVIDG